MATRYLSPSGVDSGAGGASAPWQSVAYALAHATVNDTIIMADGTYPVTSVLAFTASQNGQTWVAANAGKAIISGGTVITGWVQDWVGGDLWLATFTGPAFRNLYVNGTRSQRHSISLDLSAWTTTSTGYIAPSPVSFENWTYVEFTRHIFQWTECHMPITDFTGGTITCAAKPNWKLAVDAVGAADYPEAITNSKEYFLSNPVRGTHYYDVYNHVVYYVPRMNENFTAAATVMADTLADALATFTGCSGITFNGVVFSHNHASRPDSADGFIEAQANFCMDQTHPEFTIAQIKAGSIPLFVRPAAAVEVIGSTGVTFPGCIFTQLGTAGVYYGGGSTNATNDKCQFVDLSGNGFVIGDMTDYSATVSTNTTAIVFTNSTIKFYGQEFPGAVGGLTTYTVNSGVSNGIVRDGSYTGLSIGLGWGCPLSVPNNASGNFVNKSIVIDTMEWLSDGSAIYLNNYQVHTTLSSNAIGWINLSNQGGVVFGAGGSAIYTDNGCSGVTATGNAMIGTVARYSSVNDNFSPGSTFSGNFSITTTHDSTNTATFNTYGSLTLITSPTSNVTAQAICRVAGNTFETIPDPIGRPVVRATHVNFNATGNQYMSCPNVVSPGASGTVMFALQPTWDGPDGVDHGLLQFTQNPGTNTGNMLIFEKNSGGHLLVGPIHPGVASWLLDIDCNGAAIFKNGIMSVYAFRWDGSLCSFWANGVKLAEVASHTLSGMTTLNLGMNDMITNPTPGMFSKLAVYSTALTDPQMAQTRYMDPRDSTTTGLTNFWELIATTETDTVSGKVLTLHSGGVPATAYKLSYGEPVTPLPAFAGGSLTWGAVANAATYSVYSAVTYVGTWASLTTGLTSPSYTPTAYGWYRVSAVNNAGESPLSIPVYVAPNPIALTLTVSGADLVVTWAAVDGADHYRYSTDGGATWTTKTNPFTITGGAKGRQPAILQAVDAGDNVVSQKYILGVGMMLAF